MLSNISFGVQFIQVTELGHAGNRIHKISSTVQKLLGWGVGGEGAPQLRLLFCKIVCHD